MCYRSLLSAVALGAILLVPISGYASEFLAIDDSDCGVRMRGEIADGDVLRLENALQERSGQMVPNADVCLQGSGQNYAEALRISRHILGQRLSTMIERDTECVEACAYVFMAGREAFENLSFPKRFLHVTGRLGFRAPPSPPVTGNDSEALIRSYREAVTALGSLARINGENRVGSYSDQKFPFPRSLIADILRSDSGQMLRVETLEQASKWNIHLLGVKLPAPPSKESLHRACVNEAKTSKRLGDKAGPEPSGAGPIFLDSKRTARAVFKGFGLKNEEICVADLYLSKGNEFYIEISFGKSVKDDSITSADHLSGLLEDGERLDMNTPIWRTLPVQTKINTLSGL